MYGRAGDYSHDRFGLEEVHAALAQLHLQFCNSPMSDDDDYGDDLNAETDTRQARCMAGNCTA